MSLSSIQLDAFLAVCRTQNFTQAAEALHVTQSALSQRIKNLEEDLGATLFTRDPQGARPTEIGARLLRYCQAKEGLEFEFLENLKSNHPGDLRGTLRIAGFSSVNRSLILPAVRALIAKHDHIHLDLQRAELSELPGRLAAGRADFVFVNEPIKRQGITNILLGSERNVVIQSKTQNARAHVYLDHDEHDSATFDYFKHLGKELPKNFRRNFVADIDSILTSVQLGLGRAIAPRHLIEGVKGIEVVKGFPEQKVPVHLAYTEQPFYTDLHKAAAKSLEEQISEALEN
jgi:DNA-binding transcriptional LysR family regulator